LIRKRQAAKALFNISLLTVSSGVGAFVYGMPSTFATPLGVVLPRFVGLAIAFFLTNQVLASIAISLIQEMPVGEAAKKVFGATGANLLYDFLVSPIALITAVLYWELSWFGILLVILPLLLIRYSYISKSQLEHANRALLNVLIKTIETRDPYTSGHSIRVSTLAVVIAEEMKLPSREVEDIRTAGLLHDIGKIDPAFAQIIRKPGVLTDEEYEIIRAHAAKGAELLRELTNLPDEIIRGVRNHHERYDGTGYPDKIKGEEIPLSSRIIMMCDSLDAMLSDRPYRKALSQDAVRAELDRCSGTQFDPEIVDAVIRGAVIARAAELVPKLTPEEAAMAGF
jgi:putative nucleotidyltransferase with HDIG domain